jgi:hypothetical protein
MLAKRKQSSGEKTACSWIANDSTGSSQNEMVVLSEDDYRKAPSMVLDLRKAGKQVGIRGRDGKIHTIVGTSGWTAADRHQAEEDLAKTYKELGIEAPR